LSCVVALDDSPPAPVGWSHRADRIGNPQERKKSMLDIIAAAFIGLAAAQSPDTTTVSD
jgi:hypothetical protein